MDLSIVIPSLNEEVRILSLLERIRNNIIPNVETEIIVVDGGSIDRTIEIVKETGVKLLCVAKGRGNQLYEGANHAKGNILYFIHSDSLPPEGFLKIIVDEIECGTRLGCFQLKFEPTNLVLRFYEYFVKFPFLVCRGGDQSMFITKSLYQKIGGFDKRLRFMEDIDIIKRATKHAKLKILHSKVITSSEKYGKNGVIRLQVIFAIMHLLRWINVAPEKIEKFYYNRVL